MRLSMVNKPTLFPRFALSALRQPNRPQAAQLTARVSDLEASLASVTAAAAAAAAAASEREESLASEGAAANAASAQARDEAASLAAQVNDPTRSPPILLIL